MADLQPHQIRVVGEKADLDEKLAKLSSFLDSEAVKALDPEDQSLLHKPRCSCSSNTWELVTTGSALLLLCFLGPPGMRDVSIVSSGATWPSQEITPDRG